MKKFAVLSAATFLVLALAASVAGATCLTCSNNHCVVVSSGHGACTEPYYPDWFCKLACPDCPTGPCDTGGGGDGGECKVNRNALGAHVPGQAVTTMSVLFRSDPALNAAIFGNEGSRVVAGAAFGRFTVDGVANTIASLAPGAGRLQMIHAFSHNDNVGVGVTFENRSGERFALVGISNGFDSQVQVNSRDASMVEKTVSVATVGSDDVQLVSLTFGGRSYILALHTMSGSQGDAGAALRIERSLRSFQNSVRTFARPPMLTEPEIFVIPVC